MALQKHTLLWWSEVETWESTFDNFYGTLNEIAYVGKGVCRVKAKFTVYCGSNSEEVTICSQENTLSHSCQDGCRDGVL